MDLTFAYFFSELTQNPLLLVAVVLTLGVIFVNGWTDAPNAIATCVVTRCMSPRAAILMAAVFNFLGVLLMSMINATVAETITQMVDFGTNSHEAIVALSAALFAIVVWAVLAWCFGIPTSESHALIAGLTGGAIALHGGLSGVNGAEWVKVLYGLVISVVLGFGLGWAMCKIVVLLFRRADRRRTEPVFRAAQIFGAAAMSFMHGAQDGQKFIGVLFLGVAFASGQTSVGDAGIPIWIMLLCSATMGIGTSVGGERIIKSVGQSMVKLEKYQGFSADLAGAANLLLATLTGIPVSSTHIKTCAIMGVGAVKRLSAINFGVVKDMMFTWFFTFPACGLISFVMAKLFMMFL